jgi:hypothetical protein
MQIAPAPGHVRRHAPQILDQPQPQHDRHGPQLAQRQRADGLIGRDEVADAFGVHASVGVGDQLQRDVIHAGESRRRSIRQSRQLVAVGPREMQTRQTDLLLDQIEIVQEPFARRAAAPPFGLRASHQIVGVDQNPLVVRQTRQQPVRARLRVKPMPPRQGDGMPAQLLAAEQLGAQGAVRRARARLRPPLLPAFAT